jgi:hypothetical protein
MELLLNLFWLILALATLVTCWKARLISGKDHVSRFSLFVVAGCVLALAFPVISVSDDLNALRAEIEESGVSGANVKKTAPHASPVGGDQVPPSAEYPGSTAFGPENQQWEQVSKFQLVFIQQGSAIAMGCRAPPLS